MASYMMADYEVPCSCENNNGLRQFSALEYRNLSSESFFPTDGNFFSLFQITPDQVLSERETSKAVIGDYKFKA